MTRTFNLWASFDTLAALQLALAFLQEQYIPALQDIERFKDGTDHLTVEEPQDGTNEEAPVDGFITLTFDFVNREAEMNYVTKELKAQKKMLEEIFREIGGCNIKGFFLGSRIS